MRRLLLLLPVALLTVPAGDAAPTAAASKRPRIVVLDAPPATTARTTARIRFRSTARRTWCRRDGKRFRRCRRAVRYRNLRPGRHVVTVRARRRGRTAVARVRWTILAPPAGAPGGGGTDPTPPAPAPPPAPVPTYEDDFSGTVLNPQAWSPYVGSGHAGNGLRRASQVKVENGSLVITAQMINGILHSGGVMHRSAYTYGRYEFRIRTDRDASAATSAAGLTWPADGIWPEHGENDIYETGGDPDRTPFYSFVHYDAANLQRHFLHNADGSQWHVMAMEWEAGAIRIFRDGNLVWTLTDRYAIPDVAHKLAFQLDALKTSMGAPVRMYVDYVRFYR